MRGVPFRRPSPLQAPPLRAGVAAWSALALGFAYLFLVPRAGAALGAWDAALQVAVLFLLFVVVPFSAVHGIDLYRVHASESPQDEARHRAGFLLHAAAGAFAIVAWVVLALTLGRPGA